MEQPVGLHQFFDVGNSRRGVVLQVLKDPAVIHGQGFLDIDRLGLHMLHQGYPMGLVQCGDVPVEGEAQCGIHIHPLTLLPFSANMQVMAS